MVGKQTRMDLKFVCVGPTRAGSKYLIFLIFLLMRVPLTRPRPFDLDLDRHQITGVYPRYTPVITGVYPRYTPVISNYRCIS